MNRKKEERKRNNTTKRRNRIIQLCLTIGAVVWIIPVISAIQVSFQNGGMKNYTDVFATKINDILILPKMISNSFAVTGGTIFIVMVSSTLAAYAFSKLEFRGSKVFFVLLLCNTYAVYADSQFPAD